MPPLECENIVRRLFADYYAAPQKAEEGYTSRHWQELHKEVQVDFNGDAVVSLAGSGFGDLQNGSGVYRLCSWLTIVSYLLILKERARIFSLLPTALKLLKRMSLKFSYDAFRQVCFLAVLEPYLSKPAVRILNIGDGYGFLSALIKDKYPDAKIVLADLGKTLLFQAHFCQKAVPQARHFLVGRDVPVSPLADFVYCSVENLDVLSSHAFDIAINIASMQEMNQRTVQRYFSFLRQTITDDGYFYCCNRAEKMFSDGEVSRLADYPWSPGDTVVWDEVCPWYRFFFSLQKTSQGLRIGKLRVPFVNYFDGPVWHRLVRFAERQGNNE